MAQTDAMTSEYYPTASEMKMSIYLAEQEEMKHKIEALISPHLDYIYAEIYNMRLSSKEFNKLLQDPSAKDKLISDADVLATLEGMKKILEIMLQKLTLNKILSNFGKRSDKVVERLLATSYNEVLEKVGKIKHSCHMDYCDDESVLIYTLETYDKPYIKPESVRVPYCIGMDDYIICVFVVMLCLLLYGVAGKVN